MTMTKTALVLAAALCLLATSTSVASAARFTSTVAKEAVTLSGGAQVFEEKGSAAKCSAVSGESAAITFPTEQIVSSMNYTTCEVPGLGKATAVCATFNFHSTGEVKGGVDTAGSLTTGECKFEVVGGICKIVVPPQLATILTYTNVSPNFTIKLAVVGLKYKSSAGCIGFEREGHEAKLSGELKVKGKSGAALALV
jgi:hypothetical protein